MPQQPLHHHEAGQGAPLVLIHGFPFDSRMWDDQLAGLSDHFRLIAVDLPGYGQSAPPRPFTTASAAQDVHELLKNIGALPCALCGLSMGGYVCFEFAARFMPDMRALVLTDTRYDADSPEAKENRNRMIQLARERGAAAIADIMEPKLLAPDTPRTRPAVRQKLRQIMESVPPQTIEHTLAALRDRTDSTTRLKNIAVPALVVMGQQDAITPLSVAEAMQQAVPGAQLAVISGAGHMPPMEQPEQF
ncbi:MAG: alpha/beta fold hydrolase, partial [Tepidisphaeraceae bacterium]